MAKVITFSRVFPGYHRRAGEPTFFVEKLLKGFPSFEQTKTDLISVLPLALDKWGAFNPKFHTIRAGHRFKPGDKFSPRVWSGRPYNSKQIVLGPDVEVKQTWDFEILNGYDDECPDVRINCEWKCELGSEYSKDLAKNDGLTIEDFESWFNLKRPGQLFDGQIICWNEKIEY